MSVHQNRDFFMKRDGYIVDNPKVGPTLKKGYWEFGNSRPFLELVKDVTGSELSGEAWVTALKRNVDDLVANEKKEYDKALSECLNDSTSEDVDLKMTVRFVDGDKLIADSSTASGGVVGACRQFENFVAQRAKT
jgi:hypothetical protein